MEMPVPEISYTLILACINNDRDSRKKLYNLLSPSIYSLILAEGFIQKKAEEILQRFFIEIFSSIENYNTSQSFHHWYMQVYKDVISMATRKGTDMTNVF